MAVIQDSQLKDENFSEILYGKQDKLEQFCVKMCKVASVEKLEENDMFYLTTSTSLCIQICANINSKKTTTVRVQKYKRNALSNEVTASGSCILRHTALAVEILDGRNFTVRNFSGLMYSYSFNDVELRRQCICGVMKGF